MQERGKKAVRMLIDALNKEATRIRTLEAEAREALFERDDQKTYTEKLKEKTMILMDLPETMEPLLLDLDAGVRNEIEQGLDGFARRAGNAWGLSSLFYMSALLYPEDYAEGDKNDFERFIERLQAKLLSQ